MVTIIFCAAARLNSHYNLLWIFESHSNQLHTNNYLTTLILALCWWHLFASLVSSPCSAPECENIYRLLINIIIDIFQQCSSRTLSLFFLPSNNSRWNCCCCFWMEQYNIKFALSGGSCCFCSFTHPMLFFKRKCIFLQIFFCNKNEKRLWWIIFYKFMRCINYFRIMKSSIRIVPAPCSG